MTCRIIMHSGDVAAWPDQGVRIVWVVRSFLTDPRFCGPVAHPDIEDSAEAAD